MQRIALVWLVIAMGLMGFASLGCGDEDCEPCRPDAADPNAVEPGCAQWLQIYYGEMEGTGGTCGEGASMLDMSIKVTINTMALEKNDEGNVTETTMGLELEDTEGHWTQFEGQICRSADDASPPLYPFLAVFSDTIEEGGQIVGVHNSLSGTFEEASDDYPNGRLRASYTVSYSNPESTEASCNLTAQLVAEP